MMAEVWTDWENAVINGVFPLRRLLKRSNHSVVYLTETQNLPAAAIKLIPADPMLAQARASYLRRIATLSHPHLIRLLDAGHCQLAGHPYLFVVMEYAEQTLDQILPHRALTPGEMREMLPPVLDALAYLHGNKLVHGQLKPQNFLVVNDQLKLASDTIQTSGKSSATKPSVYDPPEAKHGAISAAGDIWGLGVTMVEALTQRVPEWPDAESETATLPKTLPAEFLDTVRRCLNRNPVDRPTVADLEVQFNPAPQVPVISHPPSVQPPSVQHAAPSLATHARNSPRRPSSVAVIAMVLAVLAAIGFGLRLFQSRPTSQQPAASSTQASSQQTTTLSVASLNPQTAVPTPGSALHEKILDVRRSALGSIRGHIKVAVRVTVDHLGNVVGVILKDPGSSKYFARVATTAAKEWKFSPADSQESRAWLLRFEFTRRGATGHAIPQS
jgi:serine/threonine protein kinase